MVSFHVAFAESSRPFEVEGVGRGGGGGGGGEGRGGVEEEEVEEEVGGGWTLEVGEDGW